MTILMKYQWHYFTYIETTMCLVSRLKMYEKQKNKKNQLEFVMDEYYDDSSLVLWKIEEMLKYFLSQTMADRMLDHFEFSHVM